jgi:branched-chain amino acid transport system ATP-binding protein
MLNVDRIHTYYGLSHILFDVSLTVSQGEVVGLLGRNGAGKSTTMRSIMGLTPPKQGTITFMGSRLQQEGLSPCSAGMAYVPDDRRVFADLTVDDNRDHVPKKQ